MKVSIRCQSLTLSALAAQEKHGKRDDRTSKLRVVRKTAPLVEGSLDLRKQYDEHMNSVKMNAAAKKPVLHFIVRFPPEALSQDFGKFSGDKEARQTEMMKQACTFIQDNHGGDAVFAARVDRDEAGETIVDVFASPKYEKRTKRTKVDQPGVIWSSASRFGKLLAEKHADEIKRRHPDARHGRLTGPRMVGIALNSEFRSFFEEKNKVTLDAKVEKTSNHADRLEIEAYKRMKDHEDQINRSLNAAKAANDQAAEKLDEREALFQRVVDRAWSTAEACIKLFGIKRAEELDASLDALETAVLEYNDHKRVEDERTDLSM